MERERLPQPRLRRPKQSPVAGGLGVLLHVGKYVLIAGVLTGIWVFHQPASVWYLESRLNSRAADAVRYADRAEPAEMKKLMMQFIDKMGAGQKIGPDQVVVRALGDFGPYEIVIRYWETLDYQVKQMRKEIVVRKVQQKSDR